MTELIWDEIKRDRANKGQTEKRQNEKVTELKREMM